jgi:hypothetical protein
MGISNPTVKENAASVFETVFADAAGESILAIGFGEETTTSLIEQLDKLEEPPQVRLLASDDVLRWVREDFLMASAAAELVAADTLSLRVLPDPATNQLLITESQVFSIVHAGSLTACTATDDAEFVSNARTKYTDAWEEAQEFSLRTPARSYVFETLTEEFDSEVKAEFKAILDGLGSTRNGDLNKVAVALLAGAKHGVQLFEISRWSEDIDFASRATFSRKKNQLEDAGLIETEKIPIDVGRPRLRLLLDTEQFPESDTTPDTIVSVSQQRLSGEFSEDPNEG